MRTAWSGPEAVRVVVQRRWNSGELLRAHAAGEELVPIRVPLKGPRAAEVADQLARIEAWISRLEKASGGGDCFELVWKQVGGRRFQRERLPSHAVVTSLEQAWRLLGSRAEVDRFDEVLALVAGVPTVRAWVLEHPLRALRIDDWRALLATFTWLDGHRGSGRHLREMSAPGVDTKFAERHRGVLAELLRVRGSATGFLDDLGLGRRPELVRLRLGSGLGWLGLSEVAVRAEELARLELTPSRALIVENEVTYLSVPVPDDGVVLWGRGFDVDRVGRLPWLAGVEVTYWGDIDTHGFAILNRLRGWLPEVRSVLMDRETLLEHRDQWVREGRPTVASLSRLSPQEGLLYRELVEDRLGSRVRLEQELICWPWALERLG
ncbi:hypothetical protein EII34_10700 [Arachnia propionica]|uniref:DUF3322 and DUF2220 domain-containing protein n=1 Tax=Arachnia propionica TaxID=1750 RepID=A0A3P1T4P9_9ACTN|nr:DUF3322 and DUF2220 domain-containing protein [Arachnia propionica]MDO5084300.1 DUF2220 family protein [Arachnia propionica]RRD04294.1 hypothetical protein EII34_10700 [Arachnia propionica]